MILPIGCTFERLLDPILVKYENKKRILGIADYKFYGRFQLVIVPKYRRAGTYTYDAYLRYVQLTNKSNSALSTIDANNTHCGKWLWYDNAHDFETIEPCEAANALVRDHLFAGNWWPFVLTNL